jgi:hypothetical protein
MSLRRSLRRNLAISRKFAIWRASCIETRQDREDDCYTEDGEDEDDPLMASEGISNWVLS